MHRFFEIDAEKRTPKYLQIINSVTISIKQGKLKKGDRIFSINELSNEFLLSRDTVQKAYSILQEKGIIAPVRGKGFYINRTDIAAPYKILLLFNKISNYKKQIYDGFIKTIGHNAVVDLKIHHSNINLFQDFITTHLNEYDYYVIMPHFYEQADKVNEIIRKIPEEKLILLDKNIPHLYQQSSAVYQDFHNDMISALEEGLDLLHKYQELIIVFPSIVPYPKEMVSGFKNFGTLHNFRFRVIDEIDTRKDIHAGQAYIIIEETDLVTLVKQCRNKQLKIGKDVGIISCNETPLKEILLDGGITVISTDHALMGETAAKLILSNKKEKIKNPFKLIVRKSL